MRCETLLRGRDGVDGEVRHAAIGQLCEWLSDRKHSLALTALSIAEQVMDSLVDLIEAGCQLRRGCKGAASCRAGKSAFFVSLEESSGLNRPALGSTGILKIADMLSSGIISQFPQKFAQ